MKKQKKTSSEQHEGEGALFVWMYVGALMRKKEAGRDLLFHLFLRINYAEMLIGGAL